MKSRIKGGITKMALVTLPLAAVAQEKPNVLFVFADQYRAQATGYSHEDPVFTPNIDALAREGVIFKNAISSCPVSTPYRGMLITGKYPLRNGMTKNCSDLKIGLYLRPDSTAFGNAFKEAGYQTGYIGKWHLDDPQHAVDILGYSPDGGRGWDTYTPPGPKRQGFDYWHAYNAYDSHSEPHYWENSTEMIEPGKWSPQHEAEVAMNFIKERDSEKPFLLMVSMNPPHPPFNHVPDYYNSFYNETDIFFNRKNVSFTGDAENAESLVEDYFASVTGVDDQFGKLVNYLKEEGLFENTIIVFTADHGEMMASHGKMNKSQWYEESINVPLVVSYPEKMKPGVSEVLVNPMDFLPTLLALSGNEVGNDYNGTDLSSSFLDVSISEQDTVFLASYRGDYDSSPDSSWLKNGWRGIRTPDHTFVVEKTFSGQTGYLYDNVNDKYQMNPLIAANFTDRPEFIPYYKSLFRRLIDMGDPFFDNPVDGEQPYSLLKNPGFEDGLLTHWNNWNNRITSDSAFVFEGKFSALVKAGSTGSVQQIISLKPFTSYTLKLWARVSQQGESAILLIRYFNDSGDKLRYSVTDTVYTEYSVDFVTGSNPSEVSLSLWKDVVEYGNVYCDNFILFETGDGVTEINLETNDDCGMIVTGIPYKINASVIPQTALDQSLSWTVINGTGSASVDGNGDVTGETPGSIEVKAESNDGTNIVSLIPLTVVNEVPVPEEIDIQSDIGSNDLPLGEQFQLNAVFSPEVICDSRIKWSIENITGEATLSDAGYMKTGAAGTVKVKVVTDADTTVKAEEIFTIYLRDRHTYYVDASGGDDLNDGLAPGTAWRSLDKVNSHEFYPGDSVLFKTGETWEGQLEIMTNGVEAYPVVFTSFGEGQKPGINGNGEKDYTVRLMNSDYTEFSDFEITNKGPAPEGGRYGVMLLASNEGSVYNTTVRNLDVHDVNGDPIKSNGGGGGIVWRIEGETPSRFVDALIEGCHIYDCERNGIVGKSAYTASQYQKKKEYYSLRLKVRQNLIERIPGDGIVMLGCDSSLVEYNVCRDFTDDLPNVGGNAAAGIWPWNSLNTTIQYNEVSGHKAGWDAQGFDSDWNCSGTTIQYNYSHDNAGGFILICSKGSVGYNDNTVVRYNISVNDGYRTWGSGEDFCPSIHLAGNIFNTKIYNNTIYSWIKPVSVDKKFIEATHWEAWPNVTYIYNNIFYAIDPTGFEMGGSTNNSINHNLYSPNTFLPPDHNPVKADPGFINAGESTDPAGYKLKDTSPAHGNGIIIFDNGGYDFFGNLVKDDVSPSIGAFNFQPATGGIMSPVSESSKLFSLYPNPLVDNSIYLKVNNPLDEVKISLLTLNGQVIQSRYFEEIETETLQFDLSAVRGGMYIILLETGELVESQKLIKL
ncbi:MAG: sulfatase-like hydrolase/transferase [Bacteroidales bacterium]|nr:sulfatase-like hydrolase/transferase [Bacteroidales bacterium]